MRRSFHALLSSGLVALAPAPARATTVGPVTELSASPASASQITPAAAWDGTRYVVVWSDGRSATDGTEIYLARIAADGTLEDSNGLPVLSPPQPGDQGQPAIANAAAGSLVLAWADPRAGASQIHAARFIAAGSGAFPDPGGIPLSAGPDAAFAPAIGCTVQSCLVAYQADVFGGGYEIRGRRLLPTADMVDPAPVTLVGNPSLDTLAIGPAVLVRASDFVLAWEDDRNLSSGALGADLFYRLVPDLAPASASAGDTLVSADGRQSAAALAMLSSSGDVWATWQDRRASSADVWLARRDSALVPLAATELAAYAGNQVFPEIAAGSDSALVVWEDFRGGAYGTTYGTLLDASGAAKAPGELILFAFFGNAIQQIVVKGPGDDYLVMAVRSTQTPARVFYRIVRDEPPIGGMTASGALQAPADGTSIASFTFGPAQGASGLPVADGTLYTVALSRSVDINVPDADPSSAGHQVPAYGGGLSFGLSSADHGPVDVTVSSVEGASTGAATIVFDNVPPQVTNVRIDPAMPRGDQALVVSYDFWDVNGDAEGGTAIIWTRDSATMSAYNDLRVLTASATEVGDVWRALVRPHDGFAFGGPGVSNAVQIQAQLLGTPCRSAASCDSGYCVDGRCCNSSCGQGARDCQACSEAAGGSADGQCGPVASGTSCRPATGACDAADLCDGVNLDCGADDVQAAGTQCRAAAGLCDIPEACDGLTAQCPPDTFAAVGAECRPAAGACDVRERCHGATADCPPDVHAAAGVECRPATGACDVADICDGLAAVCPTDTLVPPGTECRAATGGCDVAEACDGTAADCPADGRVPAGVECRPAVGACDAAEACDGIAPGCPADEPMPAGTECRAAAGDCDVADTCDGQTADCPTDARLAAGAECRPAAGACDELERCDGQSVACPADRFAAAQTVCRVANGLCDVEDRCDGVSAVCSDALAPDGVICRPAAGACDTEETCAGTSAQCPADGKSDDGAICDDGDRCTAGERCLAGQCTSGRDVCAQPGPKPPDDDVNSGCTCVSSRPGAPSSTGRPLLLLLLALAGGAARRRESRLGPTHRARDQSPS